MDLFSYINFSSLITGIVLLIIGGLLGYSFRLLRDKFFHHPHVTIHSFGTFNSNNDYPREYYINITNHGNYKVNSLFLSISSAEEIHGYRDAGLLRPHIARNGNRVLKIKITDLGPKEGGYIIIGYKNRRVSPKLVIDEIATESKIDIFMAHYHKTLLHGKILINA